MDAGGIIETYLAIDDASYQIVDVLEDDLRLQGVLVPMFRCIPIPGYISRAQH